MLLEIEVMLLAAKVMLLAAEVMLLAAKVMLLAAEAMLLQLEARSKSRFALVQGSPELLWSSSKGLISSYYLGKNSQKY